MNTDTTDPTQPPTAPTDPAGGPQQPNAGPRVTREQVTDLARLRRTSGDRKVAGVCGGLARHLDIDPLLVRVVMAVLACFGIGLVIYVALWVVVPDDLGHAVLRLDDRSRTVAVGIGIGVPLLAVVAGADWGFMVVVAAVVAAVLLATQRGSGDKLGMTTGLEPGPAASPAPASVAEYDATTAEAGTAADSSYLNTPPPLPPVPVAYYRRPPNPRKRGPLLFLPTLLLIVVALGVLGIVALSDSTAVALSTWFGVPLAITAAALLLSAFWGRGGGLIALGLALTIGTAGAHVAEQIPDASDVTVAPVSAALVSDSYAHDTGEFVLDLSKVKDLPALDGQAINLKLDAGRITIRVPNSVTVDLDATVDTVGAINVPVPGGISTGGGFDLQHALNLPAQRTKPADRVRLQIDATVGIGEIYFERTNTNSRTQ